MTHRRAKITVVADGFGADFLLEDAEDRNSVTCAATVSALVNLESGVRPSSVVKLAILRAQAHAYVNS